jgi:hypothetical protein
MWLGRTAIPARQRRNAYSGAPTAHKLIAQPNGLGESANGPALKERNWLPLPCQSRSPKIPVPFVFSSEGPAASPSGWKMRNHL